MVHWCLSQNQRPDSPLIPPYWLQSADTSRTAKTMMLCYHEDKTPMVLAAVLNQMGPEYPLCHIHPIRPPRPACVPKLVPHLDPESLWTLRRRLISRIQRPDAVLTALQRDRILNSAKREVLSIHALHKDKNWTLLDLVLRKGQEEQLAFCRALSQSEPLMLEELKEDLMKIKVRSFRHKS